MDDKKKVLPEEETKDVSSNKEAVVEFDDIRNALDKIDAKKASMKVEEEKKSEKAEKEVAEKEETDKKESEPKVEKEEEAKKESEPKAEKEEETKEKSEPKAETEEETKKKDEESGKREKETKALTQSKRLADAKAAKEEQQKENPVAEKPVKEKKSKKKGIAIFFGVLVAMLVIVYTVGFVYFSNYFYPDVAINGTNVSNMNKEQAKNTLDNFYKDYVLTMNTIDGKQVTIAGSDILMNITLHDEFDNCLKKQEPYLWFVNMMHHHDYTIGADATWDADSLENLFGEMKMLDKKLMVAPVDAFIGVKDGKFAIVEENLGTTILVDKFKSVVTDSLFAVTAEVNLQDAGCYELPSVYSTDEELNKDFEAKSEFLNGVITLQLDDFTLEPGMDLYDTVLQKQGEQYVVSKTQVEKYVKDLANEYDTMGKDRLFTTSFDGGKQVKVSGTAFGYEMNQEATVNALYSALQEKKTATVEAVFKTKGYTLQGENDIGNTYIEVNLSEQKVVAYKDGKKIVEGDCVSGCEANGNGTCLGLYAIQDKLSPTVLRGEKEEVTKVVTKKNKKGKKVKVKKTTMEYSYESPVTFWLQFNGGFGLHDAAGWRSSYGGEIYRYNGSHGCVNLPYDVAEKLYENFQLNDPVVVYFWDNENRQ